MKVKMKKSMLLGVALAIMFAMAAGPAMADMAAAKKWVDEEFQPSTLSKERTAEGDGMVHQGRQAV
jgi:H+/gluconate symporter-like permease